MNNLYVISGRIVMATSLQEALTIVKHQTA